MPPRPAEPHKARTQEQVQGAASPRYTSYERLKNTRTLDEAF
ncbi:MAG: hypothetical protein AVDCRST_MAG22-1453 [uncultured Rubrobacteraceae bacterium]|uniref:Uncharacterized protein n=1 Tax=uncultured Rubrobacteraceae bacterium TaxID=349277 RepID=A0A6J4P4W6_9ACTN|nr:MAG: hypothetical protein AVDCRST_MAG22-1453 [uncultured Rubrobacteraceae bacterium]